MRLYIIRHADPDYENNTITEKGHREAEALACRLQREKITKIFSSSMQRALDTAIYTSMLTGIKIEKYDWLREFEWNDYVEDYINPWDIPGKDLLEPPNSPTWDGWRDTTLFNAEGVYADLNSRICAFDKFLHTQGYDKEDRHYRITKDNHERIAIFCHAGFGNAIISYLLNIPLTIQWAGFWMAPSSVTTIAFSKRDDDNVSPRCIAYGDVSHLYKENLEVQPRGYLGDFY